MGWFHDRLSGLDERNQAVSDYLLERPDAGTKLFPYAKSQNAQRVMVALAVAVLVAALTFGLIGLLIVGAFVLLVTWRMQHHPWLGVRHRPTRREPENAHDAQQP